MVYCCVPQCGTDSWRCDPSITFHDFPTNPDLAAKWIHQINHAIKSEVMWFPGANPVVCSKHFLSVDYKDDSDSLKPRVIPTVFGHKYIGQDSETEEIKPVNKNSGPLIVKIKTEDGGKQDVIISRDYTQNNSIEAIINEPEFPQPKNSQSCTTAPIVRKGIKTYSKQFKMGIPLQTFKPTFQEISPKVFAVPNTLIKTNVNKDNNADNRQPAIKYPLPQTFKIISSNAVNTPSPSGTVKNVSQTIPNISSNASSTPSTSATNQNNLSQNLKDTPANAQNKLSEKSKTIKKKVQKRDNNDNNLIEIGPNTFLKINPDIIKVNKKLTPSGNTVLQFLMDQNLANSIGTDVLPKIVQGAISNIGQATSSLMQQANVMPSKKENESPSNEATEPPKTDGVVQHVVGHLVDTHVCKESCSNLQGMDILENDIDNEKDDSAMDVGIDERNSSPICGEEDGEILSEKSSILNKQNESLTGKADSSCIAKAPILLTTNMPLAHCFMEKTKYLSHLRQKARQIASLKQKVSNLNKKIEELEDRCVVQERQLSFSFLKKLRTIRRNASKGDPPATYILEQIRAYTGQKQMRWSDSTLQQCAVWCKKAPYAYEYFKKADFFKLPCLGTVKRFMKKHPEMAFSNKTISNTGNEDGESSSDFNFDEEDSMAEDHEMKEDHHEQESEESNHPIKTEHNSYQTGNLVQQGEQNTVEVVFHNETGTESTVQNIKVTNATKSKTYPVTVDGASLEVQEIILPSGEVVQCYSSNICNSGDSNSQYYIIPSTGDSSGVEHEYSIVQSADSVPVILQNLENSNLQQDQLIFITNSSDQVECTETEVMTAR